MKRTDVLHAQKQAARGVVHRQVNQTLSEGDILCLQDAFLINGFHSIRFSDQHLARAVIHDFLQSLPIHSSIACLTTNAASSLPAGIFDIYTALYHEGLHEQAIEEFFINDFYFDLVWIEISDDLLKARWYAHFSKIMEQYGQQMPIIKVYCEDTRLV